MDAVVVRPARPDEAETLAAIQAEASLAALAPRLPARASTRSARRGARPLAGLLDARARVLVAEADGEPVGVAAVQPGWLDGLYVVPARWGSGSAGLLHDSALEAHGPGAVKLWVLEHNLRARRFYERRGWSENGETRVVPFPPHPLDVGYGITRTGAPRAR